MMFVYFLLWNLFAIYCFSGDSLAALSEELIFQLLTLLAQCSQLPTVSAHFSLCQVCLAFYP